MKVIFDCDNTIGMNGCDVDDGLALMYLLGNKNIELLGITTTFGNNQTELVYKNTRNFLEEIGRRDIPLYLGGLSPLDYKSQAVDYLFDTISSGSNIHLLATGSLTNIAAAFSRLQKADRLKNIASLTLMGGITAPLIFEKRTMDELNFSVDYESSLRVLTSPIKINVLTGNNCLSVIFKLSEYRKRLLDGGDIGNYILNKTSYWFDYNETKYGIHGFYNWDVTAAAYLTNPSNFSDNISYLKLSLEDLRTGFLRYSTKELSNAKLNFPSIQRKLDFKEDVYRSLLSSHISPT